MTRTPTILRAPETGAGADTEEKIVKERIADHGYVGADGTTPVEDEEDAAGITYTLKASGEKFLVDVSKLPGSAQLMLAIFGAKTLATNEASQARQKGNDQIAAIRERFDVISSGKWVDRAGGGQKIDLDVMAQAVVNVGAKAGKSIEVSVIRTRLDDATFLQMVKQNPAMVAEYGQLRGRQTKSVDDIFAGLGG